MNGWRVSGFLLLTVLASCSTARHSNVIHLLTEQDRHPLYTYLTDFGKENDPDRVFSLTNGLLHISGQHYGYIATRETNFSDYVLVAEFKWGEKSWPPRLYNARDSGILVHGNGKDQVWPKCIEAQMIEGGTGDILVVSGAYLTVDGVTKGPAIARFDRPGRNPWKDELGFRGPHEIENAHGKWNRMVVRCDGNQVSIAVNGHKTLSGTNAIPHSGRIMMQSEGAEVFFRRVDLYPLKRALILRAAAPVV